MRYESFNPGFAITLDSGHISFPLNKDRYGECNTEDPALQARLKLSSDEIAKAIEGSEAFTKTYRTKRIGKRGGVWRQRDRLSHDQTVERERGRRDLLAMQTDEMLCKMIASVGGTYPVGATHDDLVNLAAVAFDPDKAPKMVAPAAPASETLEQPADLPSRTV